MTAGRPTPVPYELRIGVTGHRDLQEPAAVATAVTALIQQILRTLEKASADPLDPQGSARSWADRFDRRLAEALSIATAVLRPIERWCEGPEGERAAGRGPGTIRQFVGRQLWPSVPVSPRHPTEIERTPIKLTAVTSLAAGADRIVARAIYEVASESAVPRNRIVEAVLPMPQQAYEEDFTDRADLDEFRTLLLLDRGAHHTNPTPVVCCPCFPLATEQGDATLSREDAYAAAGRHVVGASEILIAIWDPSRHAGRGGTEDTVREALDRGRLVLWLNPSALSDGPKAVRASAEAKGQFVITAVPTRAKDLSPNFHRVAAYNRDRAVSPASLGRELRLRAVDLDEAARRAGLPDAATRVLRDHLLPHFVRADLLGQRYRRLRDTAAGVWPSVAALIVTLMAFQIVFLPSQYWLAWVELAVLAVGYVSNRVSDHEAWHDKWLNDRRLAEGLRGAMYATLAPAADPKPTTAGPSVALPFYDSASAWYVASMKREVAKSRRHLRDVLDLDTTAHRQAVASFLQDAWVLPQVRHHRARADSRRRRANRADWRRLGLFAVAIIVAVLHALGVGHHGAASVVVFRRVDLWLSFATVIFPAWAGAQHVILSLHDDERLADRSGRMADLLEGLARRFGSPASAEVLRRCVADVEQVMDLESAEWAESLTGRRPEFTA
jgi:hypothetical protein